MSRNREYKRGIQTKLSLASGLLVLLSLASFGLLSYFVTRRTLDKQMGEGLISHAKMVAATLQRYEIALLSEESTAYSHSILQEELDAARTAAKLYNIILIGAEDKVLADANGELQAGVEYGILKADRVELDSVWKGEAKASLLYPDKAGRLYKSAYAPVKAEDGLVMAVVRVEASARFLSTINSMGLILLISGVVITAMAALVGMLIARSIVNPIKKLVIASQRIAGGDLNTIVLIKSRDEIGFFARTFNQMARNLRKLYQEVEQRGRQIAELSASVAHEVRSPISTIQGYTELLEDDLDDDDPGLEYIAGIKNEIKILNSKITDFIYFARPLSIEPIPVDVIEILDSALISMEKEITDSGVSIITNLSSEIAEVQGDFDQLRSLFINLIRNAVQAMDKGGGLIVSARMSNGSKQDVNADPDYVEVRIEDTGCGINPETLDRAFDPFFTTKGIGTGLGLAISKKIVDIHNGKIELENNVGLGATVTVFLPIDVEE